MKKIIGISIFIVLAAAGLYFFSSYLFVTNKAGFYQIKQAAITGKLTVHNKPGMYPKFFGSITTYQISDMNYFSKSSLEGGSGEESDPIRVRFNDGGTADISGSIKFRLSLLEKDQLLLHQDFKSYAKVQSDLVRQVVTEALMQTATLMKAEESYSSRRSEFTTLAEQQIRKGIFETESRERKVVNPEGKEFIERTVQIKLDKDKNPIIRKISPFKRYNIQILQFVIKDIDFDQTIDALIAKKKEAEQQKIVAQANAERAKQDAITAEEQGKARIAQAKADEEVIKIKAVTEAKKEFEVSQLMKQKAQEDASALLIQKEAEAKGAALLVRAGLAPKDRALIDKEKAVGIAQEMAKIKLPQIMIIGGDKNGAQNPFDAIGMEAFLNIMDRLSSDSVKK